MSKKIPYWEPIIDQKDYKSLSKVFKQNFVNQGPLNEVFENKIKKNFRTKYAVTTNNCTTSIFMALKAIDLRSNDEVIIPNLTWIAVANATKLAGGKVILCDVDKDNFNLDFGLLKKLINKRTKAVIYVHNSGRSGNIYEIAKFLKKKNIFLIEDVAEGFYSKYKKKFLGTYGDFGCYSFTPNKLITCGQGGLIICKKREHFNFIKKFKNQGVSGKVFRGNNKIDFPGFNFKFSDLQASVCLSQMGKLKKRISRLLRNYKLYNQYLKNVSHTKIIHTDILNGNIPLWVDCYTTKKKKLLAEFRKNKIGYRDYWTPISSQRGFINKKKFYITQNSIDKLIWLPSSYTLTDFDVIKVCKIIKNL